MRSCNPRVAAVGTAVPEYRVTQEHAKDFARDMFSDGGRRNVERLLPVFDHAGVEGRHLCVPFEWATEDRTFAEKNELYVDSALQMCEAAAHRALEKAGVDSEEVAALIFVSNTGTSSPSVGSKLVSRLGLRATVRVFPVYGLGCAGGAAGLGLAADAASIRPGKFVLLVGTEIASYTYQRQDLSKANLISSAIFADGAAAVVLGAQGTDTLPGPEVLGAYSTTWPDTEDIMGWDYIETGMKVNLSRSLPDFVRDRVPETLQKACAEVDVEPGDLKHFITHPGGPKLLDAMEDIFGLERGGLKLSRSILRDYGNMSSVTVHFILQRFIERGEYESGDLGVLSAFGPGFSCEHVLFRC